MAGSNPVPHEFIQFYASPLGLIRLGATPTALACLDFINEPAVTEIENPNEITQKTAGQLAKYFSGDLKQFDIPLNFGGTDFQHKVWTALLTIPYGETISYLQLSKRINNIKAIRAVGAANGRNPISIIIPCHRVIGNSGDLIGYGGGLWRKKWLLIHEGALPPEFPF